MKTLKALLEKNKLWAESMKKANPTFFKDLTEQQKPELLWIGCSDSRVPANQIIGLPPGEVFVHRNIANLVHHTDLNSMSVVQFAVDHLKVKHVIVCGHYGCGGIRASMAKENFGLVDNWVRSIKDVYLINRDKLDSMDSHSREMRLTELNVMNSLLNLSRSPIIQQAWERGQELSLHGWCYKLSDGLINDLGYCVSGQEEAEELENKMFG